MLKRNLNLFSEKLSRKTTDNKSTKPGDDARLNAEAPTSTDPVADNSVTKLPVAKLPIINKGLTGISSRRLMKEYQVCFQISQCADPAFKIELVDNCLSEWNIMLYHIDRESKLYKDMKELKIPHILLNVRFLDDFPFSPPFLRVVYPRISKGYVLSGGAICMELLTKSGWCSVYTVEAVIMQFSSQVVKGNGRIHNKYDDCYHKKDAESTFKKLHKFHEAKGWYTPPSSEG